VAIGFEPLDVGDVLALETRDRLFDRLRGARRRLQLAAQIRELLLGGDLSGLRRRDGSLQAAALGFELEDACSRRLVGDEERRLDPALAAVGQPHVRHVRVALEDLDDCPADEVLERLLARIGRRVEAKPQAIRDVDGLGPGTAGPRAEHEAEKALLTHPKSPT